MPQDGIQNLLSDPQALSRLLDVVSQISTGLSPAAAPQNEPEPSAEPEEHPPKQPSLLHTFAGLDPKLIRIGTSVFDSWNEPEDEKQALLAALKPFLSPAREGQIDQAMRISRLAKVVRVLIDAVKEEFEL